MLWALAALALPFGHPYLISPHPSHPFMSGRLESPLLLQVAYAWLGFCAFPVHVLLGLFSREVVPANVSSSAGGFVKCIAQVGGAFAGYPLGLLQQRVKRTVVVASPES